MILAALSTYLTLMVNIPEDYETFSAKAKRDQIVNTAMNQNDWGEPSTWGNFFTNLAILVQTHSEMWKNMTDFVKTEFFPNALRIKWIHTVGEVAKIKMTFNTCLTAGIDCRERSENSQVNYGLTGIFADKEVIGLIRASPAIKPNSKESNPTFGMKIFRNNKPSCNILGQSRSYGLKAEKNDNPHNFFSKIFMNHVKYPAKNRKDPDAEGRFLTNVFQRWEKNNAKMIGLADCASFNSEGVSQENVVPPYHLIFVPTENVHKKFKDIKKYSEANTYDGLSTMEPTKEMFDIHILAEPVRKFEELNLKKHKDRIMKKIGTVELERWSTEEDDDYSTWKRSAWLDENLHFSHNTWGEELKKTNKWDNFCYINKDQAYWEFNGPENYDQFWPHLDNEVNMDLRYIEDRFLNL